MEVPKPKAGTIRVRAWRNSKDPESHALTSPAPGPRPPLEDIEPLLVAFIEECAELGIYMSLKELSMKMADLIHDKPVGDAYATFAAKSRGETKPDGTLSYEPQDFEPGTKWARNFLARHAHRLHSTLPTALDSTREKWQTVDNFAWWYLCLERFLVKYSFASINAEYAGDSAESTLKRVFTPEHPRLVWDPERLSWLMMWDEVGLSLDMADQNDSHNSGLIIAPAGKRAQTAAPKSSTKGTLIAPLDGNGVPLPPILIVPSTDTSSIFARSDIQTGINYFTTEPAKRFPGMPKVPFMICPPRRRAAAANHIAPRPPPAGANHLALPRQKHCPPLFR